MEVEVEVGEWLGGVLDEVEVGAWLREVLHQVTPHRDRQFALHGAIFNLKIIKFAGGAAAAGPSTPPPAFRMLPDVRHKTSVRGGLPEN